MNYINSNNGSFSIKVKGDFSVIDDRLFKDVIFNDRLRLDNFWKVHLSPKIEDYVQVLDKAAKILISSKVNFKFVKNEKIALSFVSTNCSMGASGKLITIYPNTVEEASKLMEELCSAFINFEGSEVLTDRPYKTSKIVFFRYGRHFTSDLSNSLIRSTKGITFEDNRDPVYTIPSWINDPFPKEQAITGSSVKKKYIFDSIIKRSNGGNVYFGKRKSDNVPVVIKEARKNISVDGIILKTQLRKNEFKITQKIYSLGYRFIPKPFEKIDEPFSTFFIYEYIEFSKISKLSGRISPMIYGDSKSHLKEVLNIIISLINQVEIIHKLGFENVDISDSNITWDGDTTYFIDLDSLHKMNGKFYSKTIGFWTTDMKKKSNIARDYQRIFFIFTFLFANQNMLFCKTNNKQMVFSNFWRWTLKKGLSPRFLIYIQQLSNIKNAKDIESIKIGLMNYISEYLSRPKKKWNICNVSLIITRVINESNIKINGTEIHLMNQLTKNDIKQIEKMSLKKLPTGLSGLSGLLLMIEQKKENNLELSSVFRDILHEIDMRIVKLVEGYALRLNSSSTVISPYIYDGVSGFTLIALGKKELESMYLRKYNFFKYISNPFSKVGGILNGLSGETLVLIASDIKEGRKRFKARVFEQLFTIIDHIYFKSSYPMMYNYQRGKLDNTYSNGVSGILDVIELALSYY